MDIVGEETLHVMQKADYYNGWLFDLMAPWVTGEIAEVGAGMGLFAGKLASTDAKVTAIDINDNYLDIIKKKYQTVETFKFDLQSPTIPHRLVNRFDSIVAVNVLEHVPDLELALKNIHAMLKSGGKLVVLIPSFQFAYGTMDRNLGHYKRYTDGGFTRHLKRTGFNKLTSRYINFWALWGWLLNGRVLKRKQIPESQVVIFDILFRPWLWLEKIIKLPLGLSLFSVSEK